MDPDLLFKIVQAAAIIGGGLFFLFKLGRATAKLEGALTLQNVILKNQAEDVTELKADVRKLGDVLTTIAVQDNRLDRIENDIREIKHGKGFIEP